jgi:hypothetical protein
MALPMRDFGQKRATAYYAHHQESKRADAFPQGDRCNAHPDASVRAHMDLAKLSRSEIGNCPIKMRVVRAWRATCGSPRCRRNPAAAIGVLLIVLVVASDAQQCAEPPTTLHSVSEGCRIQVACGVLSRIRDTPEACAETIGSVTSLDFRDKGITSVSSGTFSSMTGLEMLNLGWNSIDTLPEDIFNGLTSLRFLYLYSNQLTTLPENAFEGLSLLKLCLTGNIIRSMPTSTHDWIFFAKLR